MSIDHLLHPPAIERRTGESIATIHNPDGSLRGRVTSLQRVPIDQRQERLEALPALVRAYIRASATCQDVDCVLRGPGPGLGMHLSRGGHLLLCDEHRHADWDSDELDDAPALRALIAGLEGL
jgi:hypothetical protein